MNSLLQHKLMNAYSLYILLLASLLVFYLCTLICMQSVYGLYGVHVHVQLHIRQITPTHVTTIKQIVTLHK